MDLTKETLYENKVPNNSLISFAADELSNSINWKLEKMPKFI
jgi:hypothetical protein